MAGRRSMPNSSGELAGASILALLAPRDLSCRTSLPLIKVCFLGAVLLSTGTYSSLGDVGSEEVHFRPPAVPLVVHDPYFSIWSFGDQLSGDWPRHWTGRPHAPACMIRGDGKGYRPVGPPIEKNLPHPPGGLGHARCGIEQRREVG